MAPPDGKRQEDCYIRKTVFDTPGQFHYRIPCPPPLSPALAERFSRITALLCALVAGRAPGSGATGRCRS